MKRSAIRGAKTFERFQILSNYRKDKKAPKKSRDAFFALTVT
jgi:hypothetical protein